ncbi:SRPBCC domain-containing protein [Micromonospora inositola]|uniref:Uncharacterized conserved protein YndB, AHSA1/START domain n=1 Tax=Micromonospora inositola TaxID=47865 RepID=A0A1C5JU26_9ACTN|nr:SRPBCC domain-containing protein [Micromonospora inositola]SCG73526.1 Uncharacterized conserved protein YndB, AHSA1/START domain [Micromonospora inositola]
MIEIDTAVDLTHPADLVWRALTDRELVARWFTEVEAVAGARGRLLVCTAGLAGFDAAVDAEVTERREPELLALRCDEAGRRTRLTCTLTSTTEGCRLVVREVLEHGTWPADQRDRREQYYDQALTGRLPAILDWLAFQQVDLRRGDPAVTAQLPVTELIDDEPAPAGRSRGPLLIAVLAGAVLAAGLAVWAVLPAEPDPAAGTDPAPLPAPTAATATTRLPRAALPVRPKPSAGSGSARPSRTPTAKPSGATASLPPAAGVLTARYATVSTRIFGYTGEVVVDNAGSAAANDWSVVVTLSEGGTIAGASGADWRQDGQTVTFTGAPVPAGGSETFTFDVRDGDPLTKAPESCTLGAAPCAAP